MTSMLDVAVVSSGYGRTEVLHGVSLEIGAHEIVSVLGANGAGKSTLLATIMGVVAVRSGSIRFLGEPIETADTAAIVRRGLCAVPERRQLFGEMTVEENLLLGAYGRADRTPASLGDDLDTQYQLFPRLRERRRQSAQSLSGGEQQMAAIARAFMARPKLLLLDEPSLGLAPLMVEQIVQCIIDFRARGGTVLLVEQNARAALGVADRGYVLATGRIAISGRADDLLANPAVQDAYLGGQGSGARAMEERIRARAALYNRAGRSGRAAGIKDTLNATRETRWRS
jgi:branched-chain amino acid transport system ATP-binding protein